MATRDYAGKRRANGSVVNGGVDLCKIGFRLPDGRALRGNAFTARPAFEERKLLACLLVTCTCCGVRGLRLVELFLAHGTAFVQAAGTLKHGFAFLQRALRRGCGRA